MSFKLDIISNSTQKGISYNSTFKSYFEIKNHVEKLSKFLDALLLGNAIGLYMQNSIEYVVAYFAIISLNKIVVPIYRKLKKDYELLCELSNSDVYTVLTNDESYDEICKLASKSDRPLVVVNISVMKSMEFNKKSSANISYINCGCAGVMLQSSGTSANPKKILHSFERILLNANLHIQAANLTEEDSTLIELPMTFSYSNTSQLLAYTQMNANIFISDFYSPNTFVQQILKNEITNATLVPTQLFSLAYSDEVKKLNQSNLNKIFYGGSLLDEKILLLLKEKCPNINFINTYGQTEAGPRITINLHNNVGEKLGAAGKPLPQIEIEIRNKTDDINGNIFVKTPCLMLEYYKNPKLTRSTIKDGWLDTGDIGYIDSDGYLYVTGRNKNIIISGGINIYPEEIEKILERHSDVKRAYVYGEPNALLGEVPCAQIEILNSNIDLECLKNYCRKNLSDYKIPYKIYTVDRIPTTLNEKKRRIK